mgnify:FL=1
MLGRADDCIHITEHCLKIRDIAEDDEFEKTKAMLRLMCELNEGRRSGEEEGYISSEDVRAYFRGKRS